MSSDCLDSAITIELLQKNLLDQSRLRQSTQYSLLPYNNHKADFLDDEPNQHWQRMSKIFLIGVLGSFGRCDNESKSFQALLDVPRLRLFTLRYALHLDSHKLCTNDNDFKIHGRRLVKIVLIGVFRSIGMCERHSNHCKI